MARVARGDSRTFVRASSHLPADGVVARDAPCFGTAPGRGRPLLLSVSSDSHRPRCSRNKEVPEKPASRLPSRPRSLRTPLKSLDDDRQSRTRRDRSFAPGRVAGCAFAIGWGGPAPWTRSRKTPEG